MAEALEVNCVPWVDPGGELCPLAEALEGTCFPWLGLGAKFCDTAEKAKPGGMLVGGLLAMETGSQLSLSMSLCGG